MILAQLPRQISRRTASFFHQEIGKITRGSHYECAALNPTRLEVAPSTEPAPLEGWALVQAYAVDPSNLSPDQITAACVFLLN
jgi:hypothetical protein